MAAKLLTLCNINRLHTSWKWFNLYVYICKQNTEHILPSEHGPSDYEANVLSAAPRTNDNVESTPCDVIL